MTWDLIKKKIKEINDYDMAIENKYKSCKKRE